MKLESLKDFQQFVKIVCPVDLNLSHSPHTYYIFQENTNPEKIYTNFPILPQIALEKSDGAGFIDKYTIKDFFCSMIIRNFVEFSKGSSWYYRRGACIAYVMVEGVLQGLCVEILPWRGEIHITSSLPKEIVEGLSISTSDIVNAFNKFQSFIQDKTMNHNLRYILNKKEWSIREENDDFYKVLSNMLREPIGKDTLEGINDMRRLSHLPKKYHFIPNWALVKGVFRTEFCELEDFVNVLGVSNERKMQFLNRIHDEYAKISQLNHVYIKFFPFSDGQLKCIAIINLVRWSGVGQVSTGQSVIYMGQDDPDIQFSNMRHVKSKLNDVTMVYAMGKLVEVMYSRKMFTDLTIEFPTDMEGFFKFYQQNKLFCTSCFNGLLNVPIEYQFKFEMPPAYLQKMYS